MKILLLRPNSGIPVAPPPIGLMYLAGYLRKVRPGKDEITIIDGRSDLMSDDELADKVAQIKPDLVGITSFSMEKDTAHRYAAVAKSNSPDCTTVIGGPYGTSDSVEALQDHNVDFTAIGEGEVTLAKLIDELEKGKCHKGKESLDVSGLGFRRNGETIEGTLPEMLDDLDDIPYPAWDMIDLEPYFRFGKIRRLTNPIQSRPRGVSIFSTRGCPYRCTYCHNVFGKRMRKRSVENVLGEIRWLVEDFKVQEIEFIDDCFNLDKPRAKAICDGMIEAGWDLRFSFPNGLRADQMDFELIDKMKKAGCYRINYAVESGTPRIQKMIKKNLNLKRAREIIDYTALKGISTGGFFMLGFRDETESEALNTINFAVQSKLHTASFFILTPFPNTEMYDEAIELGYDMEALYSDYGAVSANLSKMSTQRIDALRKKAFKSFYFSPNRMISIWNTTPGKWTLMKNFLRAARMGVTGKEF
ncbi:hypothetical protein CEE37_03265 [candidate division LCP-89 bacterium B3_LCP]|uniref:Uncharacterized protein n=1 Tax=candidate division LCP-89 bacterium B3_LCP TaxID=2012998 RepID=A0A532V380_UNCL8|nr:MAG: hypothetical protein CEE37_03265 [candidate division LCP-89 bacterium B3_LCP]